MLFPGQPTYARSGPNTPLWTKTSEEDPLAIDVNQIKAFLKIPLEDTTWDAEYTMLSASAQRAIEQLCGNFSLVTSTWVGSFPCFYNQMRLNRRPFQAVSKIEYVAPATGTITTVPTTVYQALPIAQACGCVFLGDGQDWPTAARRIDAVRITVTAGFDASELPADVENALLMTIAALDKGRGDGGGGGGRMTVYAMKHPTGAQIVPPEARALLAEHILRII